MDQQDTELLDSESIPVICAQPVVENEADELTCSESSETSEGTSEDEATNYSAPSVHEEIEMLLLADNNERMELIATDPKFYLDLVQHYSKTASGQEIYLPDLFNIIVSRTGGQLKIKFKMSDNTQWYEVGYDGDSFNDNDVYKAFTEKIETLIRNPPPDRRDVLADTTKPHVSVPTPMVSQGNQSKLTKIDRFLGRTSHAFDQNSPAPVNPTYEASDKLRQAKDEQADLEQKILEEKAKIDAQNEVKPDSKLAASVNTAPGTQSHVKFHINTPNEDTIMQLYVDTLKQRIKDLGIHQQLSPEFDNLVQLCPDNIRDEFKSLASLLCNSSQFVSEALNTLPSLSGGQRALLTDFLHRNNKHTYTHSDLCDILDLSSTVRDALYNNGVDLSRL